MRRLVLVGAVLAALTGTAAARPMLAYVTGTAMSTPKVWLANADGSGAVQLGPGQQPVLAPDGTKVAAALVGNSGSALAIYQPGAATQTYYELSKVQTSPLGWSADSRYVAVELFGTTANGAGSGLGVIDTVSGMATLLAAGSVCGASFGRAPADRLVYGFARGQFQCVAGRVNLFTSAPNGSGRVQLTRDNRSLNPVWGPNVIAFDRTRSRGLDESPVYQLWTMRPDGRHRTQITHLKVPPLLQGVVPLEFSASGRRLLAAYEGQDTMQTWTVNLRRHRARQLTVANQSVLPGAISRDGRTVLVDFGSFMEPPNRGDLLAVPFGGGAPTTLVKHAAEASWNR